MLLNRILILAILATATIWGSDEGMKTRMSADLDVLRSTFESQYAPSEWKETYAGWNIQAEIEKAKAKVKAIPNITIKDYQHIVKEFFDSSGDYHVTISFYSTEVAFLPFLVKSAEGRYFIIGIDRKGLPQNATKLQVGDEVVTFDGKPIQQAINEFQNSDFNFGKTDADKSFAEIYLTTRLGSQGHKVPKGDINVGIKHKGTTKVTNYKLTWDYSAELIKNISLPNYNKSLAAPQKLMAAASTPVTLNQSPIFKKSMLSPYYEMLKDTLNVHAVEGIGTKESFIPALGKKLWESTAQSHFYAYIYQNAQGKRIGYVRIPHYNCGNKEVDQFRNIILKFQNETDALVIDQVNNPGGNMFYMYALASMLSDKSLKMPPHRITITQKDIFAAIDAIDAISPVQTDEEAIQVIGDNLDGLPVNKKTADGLLRFFNEEVQAWNSGKTFTDPLVLYGFDEVAPDQTARYTKPILVLINQLDISCGDFFPALLQDNHRATLFGNRTAGAGGFVLMTEYPNLFGIKQYTYTGSIAYRVDNNPIENLGVTPDIPYTLTAQDLTNNYSDYVKAVNSAVQGLFK